MDKQQFFGSFSLKSETIDVNGMPVKIRELNAGERGRIATFVTTSNPVDGQALMVAMACDMFDESDVDNIKALPVDALTQLSDAIINLSGLGDDDDKKN